MYDFYLIAIIFFKILIIIIIIIFFYFTLQIKSMVVFQY
jgi:hypothetical protein